jgi:hypothetical protein
MDEGIELYGLAFDCPYQSRRLDCPFHAIENLSFFEKYIWIRNFSQERKLEIIEKHYECSKNRF